MINRTKVKESTQIKPGDNGDVLVMKDNAPEWSTPSDAGLAEQANVDSALAEKQDKLTAGDNIHIVGNTISADGKPTPIAIGTVTSGEVPMVSNSGTNTDVILNFVLPKGDKGDKGDQGLQGPQGPVGAPFQVKKIYDSVEAMNADYSGSDVAIGEFVLIDTGDVQDPDNSKLYVKGPAQYDFVTDLSGAQGIQGPQGTPGTPAGFGNITATVDSTTGTPQVSVQADGPNTAKNISFSFTGLKGEKGDKGDPGQDGTQINSIAPLMVDTAPTASGRASLAIGNNSVANGNYSTAIGQNSTASSQHTVALGESSDATGYVSTAIGGASSAAGDRSTAIGDAASASGNYSTVVGHEAGVVSTSNIIESDPSWNNIGEYSVALGAGSLLTEDDDNAVSFGNGGLGVYYKKNGSNRLDYYQKSVGPATRRLINVTDPTNAQDAATKNYVDTQLTPINAKLQYVPENTNQILSQIQTNVEKAQAAAEAAQTTADGTQASLTTLQNTVNQQAETIAQLQQTITQLQATINNLTLETERI